MSSPTPPSTKPITLITGANQGIGLALARALARHNHHILLCSRNPSNGTRAAAHLQHEGLSVEPITLDITCDDSIAAAVSYIKAKYGYIDVLVNNAGICLDYRMELGLSTREIFNKTMETNVAGTAVVTEACVELLEASPYRDAAAGAAQSGLRENAASPLLFDPPASSAQHSHPPPTIVFVSSTLGSLSDRSDPNSRWSGVPMDAYRCSKAALNMLCVGLANHYREKGWRINAVCPGSVKTAINGFRGDDVESGVPQIVKAVLEGVEGVDGRTGGFVDGKGRVGW